MDVKLRILIELLICYSLVYFTGFLNKLLIFNDIFCSTKAVWTYIHMYSGEWVKGGACILRSVSERLGVFLFFNHAQPKFRSHSHRNCFKKFHQENIFDVTYIVHTIKIIF